jgi:hypothetical protein
LGKGSGSVRRKVAQGLTEEVPQANVDVDKPTMAALLMSAKADRI